jgi:hypothetical protein
MDFDFKGMDTKTLSEEGVDMPVRSMGGKPLRDKHDKPVTIKLLGPDSMVYRKANRDMVRKRVRANAVGETETSFDDEDAENISLLARLTVGWSGVNDPKGDPIPFSYDAAVQLYTRYPVIRDQVDLFVANRGNFISAS